MSGGMGGESLLVSGKEYHLRGSACFADCGDGSLDASSPFGDVGYYQ